MHRSKAFGLDPVSPADRAPRFQQFKIDAEMPLGSTVFVLTRKLDCFKGSLFTVDPIEREEQDRRLYGYSHLIRIDIFFNTALQMCIYRGQ